MNASQVIINRTDWGAVHGLALFGFAALAALIPVLRIWPLLWLVPLAAYAALVVAVSPLRATFRPWRFGRVTSRAVVATLAIAIGSCSVLVTFNALTHPDLRALATFLPVSALGGVLVAGAVFPVLNALLEEVIFRGILFDSVESQWGVRTAIVATAILFGYGHMHGYPPGPLGAVLAGVFGLCLGWLRVFTGGIGLPIIAHIAADATIFALVARSGAI